MKIPRRGDPHGDQEGALPRARVLDVLVRHGVSVMPVDILPAGPRDEVRVQLSTEWAEYVFWLGPTIGGLQVKDIARRMDIAPVEFYLYKQTLDG